MLEKYNYAINKQEYRLETNTYQNDTVQFVFF